MDRLFGVDDVARKARRSTDLVPVGLNCPHGHGPLVRYREAQPALFIHGGYGAVKQTTWHPCSRPANAGCARSGRATER